MRSLLVGAITNCCMAYVPLHEFFDIQVINVTRNYDLSVRIVSKGLMTCF